MTIGQIASRAGLRTSAIRYYEEAGLLPRPSRVSGRRDYDESALALLALIAFAKAAGFTVRETKQLIRGGDPISARWRKLATEKLAELDAMETRIKTMKSILAEALRCGCMDVAACGRLIVQSAPRQ